MAFVSPDLSSSPERVGTGIGEDAVGSWTGVAGETASSPRTSPPWEEREKLRPVDSAHAAPGSCDSPHVGCYEDYEM
jgi:hypothetical protein